MCNAMVTVAECPPREQSVSGFGKDIGIRASRYCDRRNLCIEQQLGRGKDGIIFQTSLSTAIKIFDSRDMYLRELACYRRLGEHEVEEVLGHVIPRLVASDDELLIIEMEIVSPPYLLDFADAYLDAPPDFSEEVMEQWRQDKEEQFGNQWDEVQFVIAILQRRFGIYLLDVHPGNITFDSPEEEI